MLIRPFTQADRPACLALLRSNSPEAFIESDEPEFLAFLDHLPGPYFVAVEAAGAVIACGGIAEERAEPQVATLCWGMVHSKAHARGIGSTLLKHRMAQFLPARPHLQFLRVNTTQTAQGFFAKHGFQVTEVKPAFYAPHLDHVRMERTLLT